MKDRRRDTNNVKHQYRVAGHRRLHNRVSLVRMMRHGFAHRVEIENLNPETLRQHVRGNVNEQNHPRHSLQRVHPIAGVRILKWIRLSLPCDPQTVKPVKEQRQKYQQRLDAEQIRVSLKYDDRLVERFGAERSVRVGVEVFEQKDADGQNA